MLIRFLAPLVCAVAVAACSGGEQASATSSTAGTADSSTATAGGAAPAGSNTSAIDGAKVYNTTCFVCHGSGAGGAPTLDAHEEWAPRVAQGQDVLYRHAIEGFTGEKGVMPAKGANASLSDDEVKAAVDYIQAQVR